MFLIKKNYFTKKPLTHDTTFLKITNIHVFQVWMAFNFDHLGCFSKKKKKNRSFGFYSIYNIF